MSAILEVRDLRFGYERALVLDGVSADVARGEILGVIGPNSVGKTTLLRLVSKVLVPQGGTMRLDGRELSTLRRSEVARVVAVVPQDVALAFPFTVRELVLTGRYPHTRGRFFEGAEDHAAADEALRAAGVEHLADHRVTALAGGERQRVLLARALAQRPRLLLLDEPSAHLDLHHQVELARLLRRLNREQGTTVVLVSHDLDLAAEVSDRLLLLSGGRVARLGTPETVLDPALIERVYRCRVWVTPSPASGRPRLQVDWTGAGESARRPGDRQ